jgi:hypothetical protein
MFNCAHTIHRKLTARRSGERLIGIWKALHALSSFLDAFWLQQSDVGLS